MSSLPSSQIGENPSPLPGDLQNTLTQKEFSYRGVSFRVDRPENDTGLAILEYVRPELAALQANPRSGLASLFSEATVLGAIEKAGFPPDLALFMVRFVLLFMALPPAFLERLRMDLFHFVMYKRAEMTDFAPLWDSTGPMTNDAFAGMPYTAQYVVLGRAACVNFYDCISEALSLGTGLPGNPG